MVRLRFKFKVKGTLCLILNNPPWKGGNARFTTVPLKPILYQTCWRYCRFLALKLFDFYCCFIFSCSRNVQVTFEEKPQLKIISFPNFKHWYLIKTWSGKAFNGLVVNRVLSSLHGRSLEIKLTVPLIRFFVNIRFKFSKGL